MPASRNKVKRPGGQESRAAVSARQRPRVSVSHGAAAILIAATASLAYLDSFGAPFIFDDLYHIVENSHIRRLWPLSDVLGETSRPVLIFTLALNYAVGGLAVWGYHAVNLVIHVAAAWTLFGIVARTLSGPRFRERYASAATGLALAVAVLWVAHPLNTQAVTYVIQRGESLAGLLYLFTLYATIRGASSARASARWYAAAAASCALGAATKPLLVSAPLVVLIYDRFFLAGSWRAALEQRRALYAALAATWGVVIGLAYAAPDPAAGFGLVTVTPLGYAATQPGVVLHYLRLAFWPDPLVLDYGWPIAGTLPAIAVPGVVMALIVAGTSWAAARSRPIAFLGLWFILVLGPSSSVFPINDVAFEHRMYLPLAALVVLIVIAGYEVLVRRARAAWAATTVTVLATALLCGLTVRRNLDYRSEIAMWNDVVAKRPLNGRGYNNLGRALLRVKDVDRAIPQLVEAVRIAPRYALAHNNLGAAMALRGKFDEAIAHYRDALTLSPNLAEAHYNLGLALARQSRFDEAIQHQETALRLQPSYAAAWDAIGSAHARTGHYEQAIHDYREGLRVDPDLAQTHNNLGLALAATARWDEAIASYERAIRLSPRVADFHVNLGTALAGHGRFDEAIAEYEAALGLSPDAPQIHNNLGFVLMRQGRTDEAIGRFREALRLQPDFALARRNLENALARGGK